MWMMFYLSGNKLFDLELSRSSKVRRKSFFDFVQGFISVPQYLPLARNNIYTTHV
jgi:hypothetical protein